MQDNTAHNNEGLVNPKKITQKFFKSGSQVIREISIDGNKYQSKVKGLSQLINAEKEFFISRLSNQVEFKKIEKGVFTYIDLFCGGGGLSLGVHDSLNFFGFNPKLAIASDLDHKALNLVKKQFKPLYSINDDVSKLVKYTVDHSGKIKDFIFQPDFDDLRIKNLKGKIKLLVGGPPCQGHSKLNNKTKGFDDRNDLYYVMPAFAVGLNIPYVVIENVESIKDSNEDVAGISTEIFKTHGYFVYQRNLSSENYGVAQTRGRHFLIASKKPIPNLDNFIENLKCENELSFDDINKDLPTLSIENKELESDSEYSQENIDRINFLHDNNLYNLPAKERPVCHQDGHSYSAVYGRIFPERPTSTVTTGFYSPGRGRYVHPHERRTINAREAGRIQAFPDYYWKYAQEIGFLKAQYSKIIGDAVPSNMIMPIIAALVDLERV